MKFKLISFLLLLLTIKNGSLLSMQKPSEQQVLDQKLFYLARYDDGSEETLFKALVLINEGANPHYMGKRVKEPRFIAIFGPTLSIPLEYEQIRTSALGTALLRRLLNQPCHKIA